MSSKVIKVVRSIGDQLLMLLDHNRALSEIRALEEALAAEKNRNLGLQAQVDSLTTALFMLIDQASK